MVSCETDALTFREQPASRPRRLLPWAALALIAATCLVGAAVVSRDAGASPAQEQLLQTWNRPFVTTKLWNAAEDDSGSYHSNSFDNDDSGSYTAFDTYGHGGGSGGHFDSDLRQILPSSELKGDGLRTRSHEWDTSELADTDWGSHSSDSSWGEHNTDGSWLGTHDHSWDSSQNAKMKAELRKMYSKGVNKIPKAVAEKAAKEASSNFFGKWAKIAGNKVASKKYGLSKNQQKLYKEAEASEQKEDAKKKKFVSAVKKVVKKETSKKGASKKGDSSKAKKEAVTKLKLKAADKLASNMDSKDAKKAAALKKVAAKKAEAKPPSKDPGAIGSKTAVHDTLAKLQNAKDAKSKQAAQKRMAALEEQIKSDFNSVTSFAHKIKTSLPPLKLAKA